MRVYDAFLFFNELDILELRLEMLYDVVDFFIISECDYTFSGLPKPFYYDENKDLFKKYQDKIIHLKNTNTNNVDNIVNSYTGERGKIFDNIITYYNAVKNTSETDYGKHQWCREILQREYVKLGLDGCSDEDIIIFGDIDEVPDASKLNLSGDRPYLLNQKNMIYYINRENITEKWYGTTVTTFGFLKNRSMNNVRRHRFDYNIIDNAGWHLTFMGGGDRVKEKIKSYSHQEYNNQYIIDSVDFKLSNRFDVLNRGITIIDVNIDEYYPNKFTNMVRQKFNYLIGE